MHANSLMAYDANSSILVTENLDEITSSSSDEEDNGIEAQNEQNIGANTKQSSAKNNHILEPFGKQELDGTNSINTDNINVNESPSSPRQRKEKAAHGLQPHVSLYLYTVFDIFTIFSNDLCPDLCA